MTSEPRSAHIADRSRERTTPETGGLEPRSGQQKRFPPRRQVREGTNPRRTRRVVRQFCRHTRGMPANSCGFPLLISRDLFAKFREGPERPGIATLAANCAVDEQPTLRDKKINGMWKLRSLTFKPTMLYRVHAVSPFQSTPCGTCHRPARVPKNKNGPRAVCPLRANQSLPKNCFGAPSIAPIIDTIITRSASPHSPSVVW